MARGRKTKLDETMIERICELIKLQCSWNQICDMVGIAPMTLRNWRERGSQESSKRGDRLYRELVERINRAEAETYTEAVKVFQNAIKGGEKIRKTELHMENSIPVKSKITETELAPNWKAAVEWLARRYPEKWGKYETLRIESDMRLEIESMGLDVDVVMEALVKVIERLADPEMLGDVDAVVDTIAFPADEPTPAD